MTDYDELLRRSALTPAWRPTLEEMARALREVIAERDAWKVRANDADHNTQFVLDNAAAQSREMESRLAAGRAKADELTAERDHALARLTTLESGQARVAEALVASVEVEEQLRAERTKVGQLLETNEMLLRRLSEALERRHD